MRDELLLYIICSNDDLIDLNLFYDKVKFDHLGFKQQNL